MSKTSARPFGTSNSLFSQIPRAEIQRSAFDRSHGYKTTFNEGLLIPFFVDEVLPGDTFSLSWAAICRLTTPIVPFMDSVYLKAYWFFVPNRLVWKNWQRFMGEQENPTDSTDFLVPSFNTTGSGATYGTLCDYFGIRTGVKGIKNVNALPFRAYFKIWNDWFRDENLQDSQGEWNQTTNPQHYTDPIGDATIDYTLTQPLRRNKFHDYFTSSLPWPQKGSPVEISLGGMAPLSGSADLLLDPSVQTWTGTVWNTGGSSGRYTQPKPVNSASYSGLWSKGRQSTGDLSLGQLSWSDNSGGANDGTVLKSIRMGNALDFSSLHADLSQAQPITINDLRQAFQIQKLKERDARGGTRYTEILRAHFGVVSPDGRLQRSEFLGSSTSQIYVSEIAQTSSSDTTTPQGNLAAYAVGRDRKFGFTKSFVEHGFIIGLITATCDLTYQQGVNRMWNRRDKYDYYWPALAHLGEQATLNKEIFAQGTADDDKVFGYQERWAEYRYYPSMITGKLRSDDAQTLDMWHLSQRFENLPTLSSQFIEDRPPIDRVVAVQSEPHFILDAWFKLRCVRPMPVRSVPGLVDHF